MKLIIDVAKFEEIICKHCMMKGENICPFDDLLLCPTIRKLEEPANTLTDGEIEFICDLIVGNNPQKPIEFWETIARKFGGMKGKIKKLKGE